MISGELPTRQSSLEGQVEHERAGVDDAQGAVDVERLGGRLDLEPLAEDDLEDVAGLDVLLALADDRLVLLAGEVGPGREPGRPVGVDVGQAELGAGLGEAGDQLVDPGAGPLVRGPRRLARVEVGVRHDQDRLVDVVEDDHPVVEGEREVGQAAVVGRGVRQVLDVADRVVAGVADRPPREPGEARHRGRAIAFDELLELGERVVGGEP